MGVSMPAFIAFPLPRWKNYLASCFNYFTWYTRIMIGLKIIGANHLKCLIQSRAPISSLSNQYQLQVKSVKYSTNSVQKACSKLYSTYYTASAI